ncbi:MAG: hypothetical protein AAFW88_09550, partial [Pseudomonadota bacterium]
MTSLARRPWVPEMCEAMVQRHATRTAGAVADAIDARIVELVASNRQIHERDCFNLNPATNVMNPKAEAVLSAGLGSRPVRRSGRRWRRRPRRRSSSHGA